MDRVPDKEESVVHRFYADPERSTPELAFLTEEDVRHALTVLRLKAGDQVELIMDGSRWNAEIRSVNSSSVSLVRRDLLPSTEPALKVTIFQGIPKSDKMDWIVQKTTELGVVRIVPLVMSRCVVKYSSADAVKRTERWRKIAREAGKQSGRCMIPEIHSPVPLSSLSRHIALPELNVVPWEGASGTGPRALYQSFPSVSSLGILIGPEGGIEAEEIASLKAQDFHPITLGKRILRTETAGLAAVSSFMTLYGEME